MNDSTHDPRHDPSFDQRPDPSRDPRTFDPRIEDSRVPNLRNPDPRNPDPRSQSPRSQDAFAHDPRSFRSSNPNEGYEPPRRQPAPEGIAEQRSPLPYSQDPRQQDPRLNDLGQRLQRFGSVPQPQSQPPRPVSEHTSTYPGGPLPVGPSTANYATGEFDRPITRPPAPPESSAAPRPQEYASSAYGIPPAAPTPVPTPSAQPAYPFMSQPNASVAEPARGASASASSAAPSPSQDQPLLPSSTDDSAAKGGFQRVAQAVRAAIPFVQKLLPLLDGNLATTVSALISSQPSAHAPVQQVHVDLEPVERGMTELRTSHRELRTQVAEQGTTLKRVEDQLERVREATDRNTLEQQELVEDVRSVGTRVSRFVVIGILLLAISVGLNVYLLIQLQHIFR